MPTTAEMARWLAGDNPITCRRRSSTVLVAAMVPSADFDMVVMTHFLMFDFVVKCFKGISPDDKKSSDTKVIGVPDC